MKFLGIAFSIMVSVAVAAERTPLRDHPLLSPYKGSKILESTTKEYDGVTFPIELGRGQAGKTLSLEGRLSKLAYENPPERSTLEVFRNYQKALERAGFKTEHYLTGPKIGHGHYLVGALGLNQASFCYDPSADKAHYLVAKKTAGAASTYVVLFVAPCKPDKTVVWVVEPRQMDDEQVMVNGVALAETIEREGHVAVYGILFDLNSAQIKPDSIPVLKEVAKLMRLKPQLSLFVVGHTDQEGEVGYNLDLSKKRAESVTRWLVDTEKISASRLSGHGVGPLAPVASNRAEEGRLRNRRVELIERIR